MAWTGISSRVIMIIRRRTVEMFFKDGQESGEKQRGYNIRSRGREEWNVIMGQLYWERLLMK